MSERRRRPGLRLLRHFPIPIVALCLIVLLVAFNLIFLLPDFGAVIEQYNQFSFEALGRHLIDRSARCCRPWREATRRRSSRRKFGANKSWRLAMSEMGSWPCQNTSRSGNVRLFFSGFDYTRIAAISGWMPMIFITLVRL